MLIFFFFKLFEVIRKWNTLTNSSIDSNEFNMVGQANIEWANDIGKVIQKWLIDNKYEIDNGGNGGGAESIVLSVIAILTSITICILNFN